MDAAVPGRRLPATSTEEFRPHPGAEHQLACPGCGDPERLSLIEQVQVSTPAEFFDVGVTMPEIDRDLDLGKSLPSPKPRVILGWRCANCSMSVEAADALSRLVPA